jgi:hypothetical protein
MHASRLRNTWHKRSTDGGVTWSRAARRSNAPGGAPYKHPRGFELPYGDYAQLAIASEGRSQATWGEGPSYIGPGASWYGRGL